MVACQPLSPASSIPLRASEALDPQSYDEVRQRLVLDGCKWDPQVGDIETTSRFALLLPASEWTTLSTLAGRLATELMAAEQELLDRSDLHRRLGLPFKVRQVLKHFRSCGDATPRVLRFDFHWTDQGWKISEVNSDVPGGYSEASELPAIMSQYVAGTRPAGHPGNAWVDAIAASALPDRPIALLSAAGYMEDRQVLAYMATLLDQRGIPSRWTTPEDLHWSGGVAFITAGNSSQPVGAIIRFYQAEWLKASRVSHLFFGSKTPVSNPGYAVLTESKRFPLVWDSLRCDMLTWRQLLPESRDPRNAPWKTDDDWLVKSALCNTGDTVAIRSLMTPRQWNQVKRATWLNRRGWIAQRRFHSIPLASPVGMIYPCVGVYTVNGRVAGIYGRYGAGPVIDYRAVDVAILIEDEAA